MNINKSMAFRNKILSRLPDLKNTGECACPQTQRFWDFYKSHKQDFYYACLLVFSTACGEWRIKALDFVDRDVEKQERLDQMKAKHNFVCSDCREKAGICKSRMKDNRIMYQSYCPSCLKILSTALPHRVVQHSVDGGLRIFEKEDLL